MHLRLSQVMERALVAASLLVVTPGAVTTSQSVTIPASYGGEMAQQTLTVLAGGCGGGIGFCPLF